MTVAGEAGAETAARDGAAARESLRQSLVRWGSQARAAELVKLVVLPGSVAVVGGFIVMFLGWYGAARSYPEVAQIPYIISGGFVGLALVILGGLLLASAVWISQLGRMQRAMEARLDQLERAREESAAPSRRTGARP